MGFLKRFGEIVLKITAIATGLAPLISGAAPASTAVVRVVVDDLTLIAKIIMDVEVMGQALSLTGTQKLEAAAPLVAQLVLNSSALAGQQIADPARFKAACTTIASGMADLLNSLKARE